MSVYKGKRFLKPFVKWRSSFSVRKYFTNNVLRQFSVNTNYSDLSKESPRDMDVVICGGGIMGAAIAYHLAKRGWGSRTLLLERDFICGDSRWSASGLVGVYKPTLAQVRLTQSSIALWRQLQEEEGWPLGWRQCGSLLLARTRDRMTTYRRMKAQSLAWNIECELLDRHGCEKLCPLMNSEDIIGGLWIPGDGVADSHLITYSLIRAAVNMGLNVVEQCRVTGVRSDRGRVSLVESDMGDVRCGHFVNCAGFWSRQVGMLSQPHVKVPLHPTEHYLLHTTHVPGLSHTMPVVRDPDGHIYFREIEGRIMAGGFEPVAKPLFRVDENTLVSNNRLLSEDWDHFHILLKQILHRLPALKQLKAERLCNGPESFSPDGKWILGEAPEITNYLVAAGMKTVGVAAAGGVGKVISDIIVDGYSSFDMYELEISRFLGLHNNRKFLKDRTREVPGYHYKINYPFDEFKTGRNLRMSPLYPELKEAGAVFGQVMGYERPTWFEKENQKRLDTGLRPFRVAETNTFGKPPWFDIVKREYDICREGVGLCDYSSFTKIDLWSKGLEVVDFLQYLCSNDVNVPVGSIIHTGMQNVWGGYENDCSLARISENHYMMIAPTIQQTRCKAWIGRRLPTNGSVNMNDVTSMYTAICIMGPFSRVLLSELTDTDLSPGHFPFFTYKQLDVGLANGIRALNLTHTGELGYVLYIPNEFALHVYSKLIEAGSKYNVAHVGYYAMRSLRVEKFYAFWGQDLDTMTTPLECGRMWRVKFNKAGGFIGREALLKQKEEGIKRQYVQLLLNNHDPEIDMWSWGGEPIYRNGAYCGQTTTTSYGFTFQKQVCLGFLQNFDEEGNAQPVKHDYIVSGDYEVDIAGIRYDAKVHLHSPNLPTKYPDQERESYQATRKADDNIAR